MYILWNCFTKSEMFCQIYEMLSTLMCWCLPPCLKYILIIWPICMANFTFVFLKLCVSSEDSLMLILLFNGYLRGSVTGGEVAGGWNLILVLALRMSGTLPVLSLCAFLACTETVLFTLILQHSIASTWGVDYTW